MGSLLFCREGPELEDAQTGLCQTSLVRESAKKACACFEDELFHHRSGYFSACLLVHDEGKPGDEDGKQYKVCASYLQGMWWLLGTSVRKTGLLRTIVSVCLQGNMTRAYNQITLLCWHAMRTHSLKEKLILCLIF
jgi:hypothetical protein